MAYSRQAALYSIQKGINDYENLETQSPEFSNAISLVNDGRKLSNLQPPDFEKARSKFELAVSSTPKDGIATSDYEKALSLLSKREYSEAVELFYGMKETADVNYYVNMACLEQSILHSLKAADWLDDGMKTEMQADISILYRNALMSLESISELSTPMIEE
jgi:hypothetical protein